MTTQNDALRANPALEPHVPSGKTSDDIVAILIPLIRSQPTQSRWLQKGGSLQPDQGSLQRELDLGESMASFPAREQRSRP